MPTIPRGWSKKDQSLILALKCTDFVHALALVNSIADIAERLQHHPDLGIRNYNEVFVTTTTHDASKLTDKDYELAQAVTDLIHYETQKEHIETFGRKS